jgi:hypothetical protein
MADDNHGVDSCTYRKCKQNHLADPALEMIHDTPYYELLNQYADVLEELLFSLRDDQRQDRRAAYMTLLRDCAECYFKATWAGLLATPVEIIHDASGASPYIRLEDITERVSVEILNKENLFYKTQLSPENVKFKGIDLLNASTHMSAMLLTYLRTLPFESIQAMYATVDKTTTFQVAALRYAGGMLKSGKDKATTIFGVRQISKNK